MPTDNDDLIYSTSRNDNVLGLAGADTFYWTPNGTDIFVGGDRGENYDPNPYLDRSGGDRLIIEGNRGVEVRFTSNEEGLVRLDGHSLKFEGVERFHGSDGNDTIRAAGATIEPARAGMPEHGVTIYAGAGHDIITATSQDDIVDGGSGNDSIWAGDGNDFIQSSTGHDLIYGGAGDENIRWGLGDDVAPGNDTVYAGSGHDLINIWAVEPDHTGAYVEYQHATKGRAVTNMGDVRSVLHFNNVEQGWTHQGRDTVTGADASVGVNERGIQFNTRWDDDILIGSRGRDTLEGGEGRDTIEGGDGNDLISANGDFTSWNAVGDGDADTLVFHAGFGHDTVLAFEAGLDILQFDRGMSYTTSDVARGTLLTFNTGDTILLSNVFDYN